MVQYTPPMGWNTWNAFGDEINEQVVLDAAGGLVQSGLAAAGYRYVVIDDCWSMPERDSAGELMANPEKFPHGMRALADAIHGMGLLFGMYSCAGNLTCAGLPGSFDNEFRDARRFAEWGVDFLKYDDCYHTPVLQAKYHYRRMGLALANCGRDILFSACSWGTEETQEWIRSTGAQMWRSTGDIWDSWETVKGIITAQDRFAPYGGVGCFNDMDMLTVGMNGIGNKGYDQKGCTAEEYRTQFSAWCLFASPLMVGCDVCNLTPETAAILTNPTALAINQDPACRQVFALSPWSGNPLDTVRVRLLSDGCLAIGIFNLNDSDSQIVCAMDELGLPRTCGKKLVLREAWTGETYIPRNGVLEAKLHAHECRLYVGKPVDT